MSGHSCPTNSFLFTYSVLFVANIYFFILSNEAFQRVI